MTTTVQSDVLEWLLAGDPVIRWQVMRDLLDLPEEKWLAERAKVEVEGWGACLLKHQDPDGCWAGGVFLPAGFTRADWNREGQPWTATAFVLNLMRAFGLDPHCTAARRTVSLVARNARWEHGGEPYWSGEVEECINGRTVADGAWFGADVSGIVDRLLADRQPDGGWNCERANGSRCSSFATTINVLEGLIAYEQARGSSPSLQEARASGEEYLLQRRLFLGLRAGSPADPAFLRLGHPARWRYDILRALDYFRTAALHDGIAPDSRLEQAITLLRSKRTSDGTWPLERVEAGRTWIHLGEHAGQPSRGLTLSALRVLRWWDGAHAASPSNLGVAPS